MTHALNGGRGRDQSTLFWTAAPLTAFLVILAFIWVWVGHSASDSLVRTVTAPATNASEGAEAASKNLKSWSVSSQQSIVTR